MGTLLVFLVIAAPAHLDFFQQGNAAYEAGDFFRAVVLYDSALGIVRAAEIYYNRGNAYFKQGQLGRALADYLRAYALKPHDPDIKNNIAFVRQFRPDKNYSATSPLLNIIRSAFTILSVGVTGLACGLAFFLLGLAVALFLISGKRVFGFISLGLALVFLYLLLAVFFWQGLVNPAQAVVAVPEAILRSGPGAEYKEIATVHDGLEVRIIEERAGYRLIQMPGGLVGWVEQEAVERVYSENRKGQYQ